MAKGLHAGPYEVMFFLAMKEGPAYGYDLARRYGRMTRGHLKISYGTIYPFLRRMEKRGLIQPKKKGRSGRIYYELTGRGVARQRALLAEIMKLQGRWEEKLLGILAIHAEVFGRKSLNNLLGRV